MMRSSQVIGILCLLLSVASATAQQLKFEFKSVRASDSQYNLDTGEWIGTNSVVRYGESVMTADLISVSEDTGQAVAEGHVRIEYEGQIWVGEKIRYNFFTKQMESESFRTGVPPIFASGKGLKAVMNTNGVYSATNAVITTDDVEKPFAVIRAKSIEVIPGESITARNAYLYLGGVPVFYWPYYTRKIGERQNQFLFMPGYRSAFGAYLYTGYIWYFSNEADLTLHTDYRIKRGPGVGPDLNFDYGRWGKGSIRYYYAYDLEPGEDQFQRALPDNRQRFDLGYQANPATNLFFKSRISYQSDSQFLKEFFESEYEVDPQPITYGDVRKHWDDFTVDLYAQPRINRFFETVERLPEVRLNVLPVALGPTPLFYESISSAGYYRRLFAETNGVAAPEFSAARADTFHQVTLPITLLGWLNVTPRVGARATYYSQAHGPGATTDETWRGVFNTGVEVSLKASRLWPNVHSKVLDLDGLRHIVQPSINYSYVPNPNRGPAELPQFDYELPSFFELPIEFPAYNDIDSIDAENVVRLGLRNRLQTKRAGAVQNAVTWDVFVDWRLKPESGQSRFSNLYSDLTVSPRSWLALQSQFQLNIEDGEWQQASSGISIQPGSTWSLGVYHWYVRDGFYAPGDEGNNTFRTVFYYKLSENWALRMSHRFEASDGRLEEQYYTLYRDLRSFTGALTFRVRNPRDEPMDYSVALALSLKAAPKYSLGEDSVNPSSLLGY